MTNVKRDETNGITLLPCPFCGGEAYTLDQAPKGEGYSVGCNDDDCRGFIALSWIYKTEVEAIAAWNTRAERTCKLKQTSWDNGTCTWGCICSACGALLEHETGIGYNFCPNCGAKCARAAAKRRASCERNRRNTAEG